MFDRFMAAGHPLAPSVLRNPDPGPGRAYRAAWMRATPIRRTARALVTAVTLAYPIR